MDDYLKPEIKGEIITGVDGRKHFTYGKTRLHVTEHFPEKGKTFRELLDELILDRIREAERNGDLK